MHHLTWAHDSVTFIDEELRLISHHLDIRCRKIAKNLVIRHKSMLAACNFLNSQGFLEVTFPILATSTSTGICEHLLMCPKNYLENLNFMSNKHPKGDK